MMMMMMLLMLLMMLMMLIMDFTVTASGVYDRARRVVPEHLTEISGYWG
jgi:hypothetical protein